MASRLVAAHQLKIATDFAKSLMASSSSSSATLFPSLPHLIHPKSPNLFVSSHLIPFPKTPNSCLSTSIPLVGARLFSPWSSCKHFGISIRQKYLTRERRKCRGRVVYASLFGVGAPEALVIGVVALLVFGPKGLAEVARNLGKTLRAFQPTIRELQEVSRGFKDSLEREIGLDEIATTVKDTVNSTSTYRDEKSQAKVDLNGTLPVNGQSSSEDPLKATEEQSTVPPKEQQGEPTLSPAELLISIQTGKAVAATNAEQPMEVLTEKKPEPTPSSDELPQATHETSVGAPPLQKLESER